MTHLLTPAPAPAPEAVLPALTRLPIQQATASMVEEAVDAATSGIEHLFTPSLRSSMLTRVRPDAVEPLDLLLDEHGPAGWAGLVLYADAEHTWETTTFFAPRLRGTGLFGPVKCWQAHTMEDLRVAHGAHLRLITSINPANTRSLAATSAYARTHGWPDVGGLRPEPHKHRTGWVIEWPDPTPHTCHRAAS